MAQAQECSAASGFYPTQCLTLCLSREHSSLTPAHLGNEPSLVAWENGRSSRKIGSPWSKGSTQHSIPGVFQDSDYVVAVRNFLSEDPELLSFHKGDIIHLQSLEPPRVGQFHGWVERGQKKGG